MRETGKCSRQDQSESESAANEDGEPRRRRGSGASRLPRTRLLVEQNDAAGDQHDAAELRQAERLVPQEMRGDPDDDIAQRDAWIGERDWNSLDRDDIEYRGKHVDGETEDREGMEKLRRDRGRSFGAALEGDLPRNAKDDAHS